MTKVVPTIHTHIFQVSMPRKRPACIIAIMDNSRDLKTHTKRQLNERLNQAPQICSLSLTIFYLILKIIDSFFLSLLSGCIDILLINQSIEYLNEEKKKKKKRTLSDDKSVSQTNEQSNN